MSSARRRLPGMLAAAGLAMILAATLLTGVTASSHREAPLITEDPVADNTDVYAFIDQDAPGKVNLLANWIPLEEPAGGPNFHKFGDDVLYTIKIDNDHDALADVTYEFRFRTNTRNPNTFLYNTGPVTTLDDPDLNLVQSYSLTRIVDGRRRLLGSQFRTAPANVGPRSTPDYEANLGSAAVYNLSPSGKVGAPDGPDTTKVFAGPRDEAFAVDLGSIFDLAGLRPFNQAHVIPLPAGPGVDATSGYNVHTIGLQVPVEEVKGDDDVIGVWSETFRRRVRVFTGRDRSQLRHVGPWAQVSRLGAPLVNEVVIPLGRKDAFNASRPRDDAQFLDFVLHPEIDDVVRTLYGGSGAFSCYPDLNDAVGGSADADRDDLVAIFLTGIDGVNKPADGRPYEAIRVNTAATESSFPNGRHPQDDVVDTALQAVAGAFGDCPVTPNVSLGDGVPIQLGEPPIMDHFPYLPAPHPGYEHDHAHGN